MKTAKEIAHEAMMLTFKSADGTGEALSPKEAIERAVAPLVAQLAQVTKERDDIASDESNHDIGVLLYRREKEIEALQSKLDSAEKELSFARQVAVLRGETIDRMERELIEAKAESRRLEGTLTQHCENPDTCRNVPDTQVIDPTKHDGELTCPACGEVSHTGLWGYKPRPDTTIPEPQHIVIKGHCITCGGVMTCTQSGTGGANGKT